MIALVYIILLVLIYGYTAGYFLKNHENYHYLKSEDAAFNFRYISMIILNLLVGYIFYTTILEKTDNKFTIYYGIIMLGLMFVIIARYKKESAFINELSSSYLPLLLAIFIVIYFGHDTLKDQSIVVKLIMIVIFVYSLTVLLTSNPWPFNLESINKMEKSSGLITLIPSNEIVQIDSTNNESIPDYKLDYKNLDSFALSFSIYIESSGLKSFDASKPSDKILYNIIELKTTDITEESNYNIDFKINYDYVEKNLVLNFTDSKFNNFITNNAEINENSYIIPITFNNNNLYKWHHVLLNFTRSGIDIYSSNNNEQLYKIYIDPVSNNVTGTNNYGNNLIQQIKFIKPANYLNYNFEKIKIGDEDNLGNDYISLSKMNFYSREINYEELDKINNI